MPAIVWLQVPLILTTSFPDAVAKPLDNAIASIKRKKYKVVLSSELVHAGDELSREESALVGYYLALDADKFSGNSVSTLTAMLILERQWLNRCVGGGVCCTCRVAAWGRLAVPQHLAVPVALCSRLDAVLAHCPQVLGALQRRAHTVGHIFAILFVNEAV